MIVGKIVIGSHYAVFGAVGEMTSAFPHMSEKPAKDGMNAG